MNICELNVSSEYRQIVDYIKSSLQVVFARSHAKEGDIYIVNHFPAATDGFGETELLIFINLPNTPGNFYYHYEGNKKYYLNSLVIGIKMLYDDSITDVDNDILFSTDGCLDYKEELENEGFNFKKFTLSCNKPIRSCAFFYWIVTKGSKKAFSNDYIFFNTRLDMPRLLSSACHRNLYKQGINCLGTMDDLGTIIKHYIDEANKRTGVGILTKQRIDKITDKRIKTPQNVLENSGKVLSILQGKAGCGKTLMLTRIFYAIVASGHHCRLLTYNNLLAFDLKQCGRHMPIYRNTNASIHTLHYFFYHLSKKMGIQSLFTEKRLNELMDVCKQRLDIADKYIYLYKEATGIVPDNSAFWKEYEHFIDTGDKVEITKYLKYINANIYSKESIPTLKESYLLQRKKVLGDELGHEIFLADYNKILETLFHMLDKPFEFYEKHDVKNRREFLNLMSKTDKMSDEDQKKEYEYVEFSKDLKNAVMRAKWSKSILIDEAQDCNNYEKLILMKIYGAENLIITSGGKDQLIRSSMETDWKVALGKPVPNIEISLGGRSYRQKATVVKFVNALADSYKFASPIQSANESKGLGRVIIDVRNSIRGFSNEILEELRNAGKVMGCSDYENCMVLLPTKGYSSKSKNKTIMIDELDNVDIIDITTKRKLDISNHNLKIWNGIVERKGDLGIPASDQTRFLYYESCRGLEAWNVFCVDLDLFYYSMRSSKDAELYARTNQNFFSNEEDMKSEFALHWVYMAITRPIDTLYIKLGNPSNEFSQKIIEIGRDSGAELLIDPIVYNPTNEDLPF
ncbi:MAG: AAA family ATPase [Prevotella sp.]|nr:AAA family ATPase [Prevotella sp.]